MYNDILSKVDHTQLKQTATWKEIQQLCDEGVKNKVASVCIPPSYVKRASEYLQNRLAICTVIGFPNGYMTTETKVFETKNAIDDGAEEIDMVINLGDVKNGDYDLVLEEIKAIKTACGNHILKVIIETCFLTEEEKVQLCKVVTEAGADYIKTSTGFGTAGANAEDLALMKKNVGAEVKIKAAGGIKSVEDAREFIQLGASRLGTSSMIKIIEQEEVDGY